MEDAEHRYRSAQREEETALNALADAIHRDRRELAGLVDVEQRAESALAKLDEAAAELDQLAEEVGVIRTVATIQEPRTRAKGFEPIRSSADRFHSPQARLAGLRDWALELSDIGRRLAQGLGSPPSERTKRQGVAA
jgi:hypothetical protein